MSASASASIAAPALSAIAWPTAPVRLICPFAAGGPTDVAARMLAEGLSSGLAQRVVVENRTGAGVVVGTEVVAKARDGHTFLYSTIAHPVLRPLFRNLPFDPVADFLPVALVGVIPMLLQVNNDVPAGDLRELMAFFRANPGRFNYGSSGAGGTVHLATELFLRQAGGLRVNHVPYRDAAPAMPDLLNGALAMSLNVASDGVASVQRGAIRALAMRSSARVPQLPVVPTVAEAGLPDYEAYTWQMVLAPADTSLEILVRLSGAANTVTWDERVRRRFEDMTMTARSDSTPTTATAWLRAEMEKWEPLVLAVGITEQ